MDKEVSAKVKWLKKVLGDRLEEADELVVEQTAKMMVEEEKQYKEYQKLESYLLENGNGVIQIHPSYTLWQQTSKRLLDMSNKLGLNPVSRKESLQRDKSKKSENAFEAAIKDR